MSAPLAEVPDSTAGTMQAQIAVPSWPVDDQASPPYPVRRFTVAEYEAIARAGILDEDSNVELLEGWIVPKMIKHPPHDSTIDLLVFLLSKLLPDGWHSRSQNVVVTDDSEPEPDIAVVRGRPGDYRDRHPTTKDVGLIIEVAHVTVGRDRCKAKIYARAGVPYYWIVNLDQRQVEVFSRPTAGADDAVYQSKNILRGDNETLEVILDGTLVGSCRVRDLLS